MIEHDVIIEGNQVNYSYKPGVELALSVLSEISGDNHVKNNDGKNHDSVTFEFNAPENLEAWLSDCFTEARITEENRLRWFDEVDSHVDEARDGEALESLVIDAFNEYISFDHEQLGDRFQSVVLLIALAYAVTRRDGEVKVIISVN